MQARTYNILLIVLLFAFSSCEKVITVKVDDAETQYVIEGVLTTQAGTCQVLVSQTKKLDDDNSFAGIGGATINITDNLGAATTLTETSTGVYEAPTLTGNPGSTYNLSIQVNGHTFTASSTMPQPVNADSVFITEDNVFNDIRKLVNVRYQDPAGIVNNYRFVQYVNGVKEKNVFVHNDDLTDGNLTTSKLRYQTDDDDDDGIKTGDQVQLDIWCIDAAVYKYWYSFDQGATGDSQTATPANPVTNIKGGALGYFSAHTLQRKTITAP